MFIKAFCGYIMRGRVWGAGGKFHDNRTAAGGYNKQQGDDTPGNRSARRVCVGRCSPIAVCREDIVYKLRKPRRDAVGMRFAAGR